jgi:hypothetical protein
LSLWYPCQIEVTETAASIGSLNRARAEEPEQKSLDLQNDVLKSCAVHKNIWNLVDRQKFPSLKSASYEINLTFAPLTCANHNFESYTLWHQSTYVDLLIDDRHEQECHPALPTLITWPMKCSAKYHAYELSTWVRMSAGITD